MLGIFVLSMLGATAQGSIGVGYTQRDYADSRLSDANGIAADAQLTWTPTRRSTVTLSLNRDVRETTQLGASGVITSIAELGGSYSVLRNLSLNANVSYAQLDFDGAGRTDNIYGIGFGADWSITRHFALQPGYSFDVRDSDVAGLGYQAHRISLTGQYNF